MDPLLTELLQAAFGQPVPTVLTNTDAGQDHGVFSHVRRLQLEPPTASVDLPRYVVAKLPVEGPNGTAAAKSGAYRREAEAYRRLLPGSPVDVPKSLAIVNSADDRFSFLLEDLTGLRRTDQLDGLDTVDAHAVSTVLSRFHQHWASRLGEIELPSIGRTITSQLGRASLDAGLAELRAQWGDGIEDESVRAFERLVGVAGNISGKNTNHNNLTLCHGDPRADNIVFAPDGRPIIFDWQQVVIQPGEFDLSWLAATSLDTAARRSCERSLVESYGGSFKTYRAGFAVPALLVLLLIQRQLPSPRLRQVAAMSVRRIGQALVDLEVAELLDGP